MDNKTKRLYFIDAIRAWAILMMLQGHFVDGLLDTAYRDLANPVFNIWQYFRGITAPVFFTVSGFIFTYLLVKDHENGLKNPRVKKGVKRGLELLFIGYLLRIDLLGFLQGEFYNSFYLIDVLHCIGLSLLGIIGFYLVLRKFNKYLFPIVLLGTTLTLFIFEPLYKSWSFAFLPDAFANYLSKTNGSVFTIFPWFGYATFGGFISLLFTRFKDFKYLYPAAIGISIIGGVGLIFGTPILFWELSKLADSQEFADVFFNNYLFIRLGNVLLVFAFFMLLRSVLKNATVLKIGQSTLSIYIVHFIILYGSFTGLGLYRFFYHALTPSVAIFGALAFMIISTYTALLYEKHKTVIKLNLIIALKYGWIQLEIAIGMALEFLKNRGYRFLRRVGLFKS